MNLNTIYKSAMIKKAALRGGIDDPASYAEGDDDDPVSGYDPGYDPKLSEDDIKNTGGFEAQSKANAAMDDLDKQTDVVDYTGDGSNLGTVYEQQNNQVNKEEEAKPVPDYYAKGQGTAGMGIGDLLKYIKNNPKEYMKGFNGTDYAIGGGSALLGSILTGKSRPGLRLLYSLLFGLGGIGASRIGRDIYNAAKTTGGNLGGGSFMDRLRSQIQNGARS